MADQPIDVETATALLAGLRWREDMIITNYDGEVVWLGICYDKTGNRIGIRDCCLASEPCDHHAAIARSQATGSA